MGTSKVMKIMELGIYLFGEPTDLFRPEEYSIQ
jgi:hypothetical protein